MNFKSLNLKSLLLDNITTKQTIFKNTFWLMIAEVATKIPIFFLNIWVVRYLGAETYGKFAFAFSFCALFTFFTDLGLSVLTIREVAKDKKLAPKYINNLLILKLILSFITFCLVTLAIQFLGKPPDVENLIYLIAIFVIITSLTTFFQSIIQAFEKMEYLVISKLTYSASLFTIVFLIIWLKLGVKTLAKGYVYSGLITIVVTLILTRKKFVKFWFEVDPSFWKKRLGQAWPFGLIGLLGAMYFPMRTIQISLISGDIETGWFNAAYQFIFVLTTLVGIFFAALFPTLSKEYGKSKTNFYKIVGFFGKKVIFFSLVLCASLFLASEKTVSLLYGPGYLKSVNMLRLLSISIFISFINVTYSEALRIMNLQTEYLKTLFCGVLLNFLLNFPLIFLWGGLGASLAAIFSSSLVTTLMIAKFKKFKKIDLKTK